MTYRGHAGWVLMLGCMFSVSCGGTSCSRDSTGGKTPANGSTPKQEIVALLHQALKDSDALDKRSRIQGNRLLRQFFSAKDLYEKYPVVYARERLIARGSSVVPILLEITRDRNYSDVDFTAWIALEKLDPPSYLKEVYQAGKEKRLSPAQVSGMVFSFLPVRVTEDYWQEDKVMDWLGKQLADKSFDQIVLGLMDDYLKADYAHGGMYPGLTDERVLRWLNRIYDIDLDSWLAVKAPTVLKFRREQLSKGYDPATSFNLAGNISDGLLDEAMVAIYPKPEDRKACKELLEAVYPLALPNGEPPPLQPPPAPGWEQRLKDWYWRQRPLLRYDSSLLRFVPSKKHPSSRPGRRPASR